LSEKDRERWVKREEWNEWKSGRMNGCERASKKEGDLGW